MRSAALAPHPDHPAAAVDGLQAAIGRNGGLVSLSYVVTGRIPELEIPPRASPTRRDELWRHTCLELFVRAPDAPGYVEVNLSPSSEWAVYAFTGYRQRAADPAVPAPFIDAEGGRTRFELTATLDLSGLLPPDAPWRVGLAAVLEARRGGLSYWSLAHPPGRPDFHHADGFALALPASA